MYFALEPSDLILCQSLTFKKRINLLDKNFIKKTIYFPSWPEGSKSLIPQKYIYDKNTFNSKKINILFTGNVGDAQNFGLILELAKVTSNEINWIIAGKGRRFESLNYAKQLYNLENLKLLGLLEFEELYKYVHYSDALLISLKSGDAFDATIPGKFQTYLSFNKRIIGLIGGEVHDIINKYNLGFATKEKNPDKIKTSIIDYLTKEFNQVKFEKNIQILKKIYSKSRNINKLFNLLKIEKENIFVRYLTSAVEIPYNRNFILSAFNLAFCGAYQNDEINLKNNNIFVWPDGYYFSKLSKLNVPKLPGRKLLNNMALPEFIEEIVVIGNLSSKGYYYLKNKFHINITNIKLPYGELNEFIDKIPNLKKNQLCLISLPTPKQEILASYIAATQKNYKIVCLGAAINMASGDETPLPLFLEKIFIAETVWRLQFESKRRIKRLLSSFNSYIKGKKRGIYDKLIFLKINEK